MNPRRHRLRLLALLLAGSIAALVAAEARTEGDDPVGSAIEDATALLASDQGAEALARAKEGLEHEPDRFELLDLAASAARAAGTADEAVWYASLALDAAGPAPGKDRAARVAAVRALIAELDPLSGRGEALRASYAAELCTLGTDLAKRKLYVFAVDVLSRLEGTALAAKAEAELAKLYDNEKAVEHLLESGVDVPLKIQSKRTPQQIAREDQKHSTWGEAWEVKGKQYTVRTNVGIETAEAVSLAMEQMNRFYRQVFRVKERGGETARVKIDIHRTRAEFDLHEKGVDGKGFSPGVRGFFAPHELRVCTYDPRESGETLSELWSTLFHEASHQFTHIALTGGEFPTWLNEGTASYFEGARLLRNGAVESNLVPDHRLGALKVLMEAGSPTLTEVVTYMKPGSYPGEYYPFGWGLVYFFLNYEDERSERVYVEPYRDFMATYKSGAKHDVMGRFVEYFVTGPKQPGIDSFEDFEKLWSTWILELHALHFGGAETADALIARARKQHADGHDEAAIETYRWALRKRPGDPVAYMELADRLAGAKQTDAAIVQYRAAVEIVRGMRDASGTLPNSGAMTADEVAAACRTRFEALDEAHAARLAEADVTFVLGSLDAAKAYREADMPLVATALIDAAFALHGPSHTLNEMREEIVAESGVDPRRWRRLALPGDLAGWRAHERWSTDGATLSCTATTPSLAMHLGKLPERYRFEARFDASGLHPEEGFVSLLFGINDFGMLYAGLQGNGVFECGSLVKEWKHLLALGKLKPEELGSFTLAVEVGETGAEFFLNGKSCGKPPFSREFLLGGVGVVAQSGAVVVTDLRVRY